MLFINAAILNSASLWYSGRPAFKALIFCVSLSEGMVFEAERHDF